MGESSRARGWCFTLNNPVGDEIMDDNHLLQPKFQNCYMVYQKEEGDNKTPHFQGLVYFKSQRTLKSVKKLLPRAHLQQMQGTVDQAEHYCTKPHDGCTCKHCAPKPVRLAGPWRFGDKPVGQGKRVELEEVKRMIDDGASEKMIADSCFAVWCRNFRAFSRYRILSTVGRTWQTEVIVYWGPTGTGKSRHALELGGQSQYWLTPPKHPGGDVWWDGYDGHETVIIDEYNFGWLPRSTLQRIIDRYPFMVETKGGAVPFVAKRIIITCNVPPRLWYKKLGLGPAMERRLKEPIGYVFFVGGDLGNGAAVQATYEDTLLPGMILG